MIVVGVCLSKRIRFRHTRSLNIQHICQQAYCRSNNNAGILRGGTVLCSHTFLPPYDRLTHYRSFYYLHHKIDVNHLMGSRCQSNKSADKSSEKLQETQVQKLKRFVKEYGATVIVFHISISLLSLGASYVLVARFVSYTFLVLGFYLMLIQMLTSDI